eukprot:GHVQ01017207.1.p1 GENE.GHVQ01017207.1~~GHVQ01017207.1.p1  ORF type:complete len:522 (-),score=113.50 GHVQ01017207.1:456-2021(-)
MIRTNKHRDKKEGLSSGACVFLFTLLLLPSPSPGHSLYTWGLCTFFLPYLTTTYASFICKHTQRTTHTNTLHEQPQNTHTPSRTLNQHTHIHNRHRLTHRHNTSLHTHRHNTTTQTKDISYIHTHPIPLQKQQPHRQIKTQTLQPSRRTTHPPPCYVAGPPPLSVLDHLSVSSSPSPFSCHFSVSSTQPSPLDSNHQPPTTPPVAPPPNTDSGEVGGHVADVPNSAASECIDAAITAPTASPVSTASVDAVIPSHLLDDNTKQMCIEPSNHQQDFFSIDTSTYRPPLSSSSTYIQSTDSYQLVPPPVPPTTADCGLNVPKDFVKTVAGDMMGHMWEDMISPPPTATLTKEQLALMLQAPRSALPSPDPRLANPGMAKKQRGSLGGPPPLNGFLPEPDREYDVVIYFLPELTELQVKQLLCSYIEQVRGWGGKLLDCMSLGRKAMRYPIRRRYHARELVATIRVLPSAVYYLHRRLLKDELVLRFIILKPHPQVKKIQKRWANKIEEAAKKGIILKPPDILM